MTKKNSRFNWSHEADKAFSLLKQKLVEGPILIFPDANLPYRLYTDASSHAVGAVLTQHQDGEEPVVQYVSHQLSESQQKWSIIEREAYAIVYSISKLRQYL